MASGDLEAPSQFIIVRDTELSHEVRVGCHLQVEDAEGIQRVANIFKDLLKIDEVEKPGSIYLMCYVRSMKRVAPIYNNWTEKLRYRLLTGDIFLRRCQ